MISDVFLVASAGIGAEVERLESWTEVLEEVASFAWGFLVVMVLIAGYIWIRG